MTGDDLQRYEQLRMAALRFLSISITPEQYSWVIGSRGVYGSEHDQILKFYSAARDKLMALVIPEGKTGEDALKELDDLIEENTHK